MKSKNRQTFCFLPKYVFLKSCKSVGFTGRRALRPQRVRSNPLRPEMILRRNDAVVNTLFVKPLSAVVSGSFCLPSGEEIALETNLEAHPFGVGARHFYLLIPRPSSISHDCHQFR